MLIDSLVVSMESWNTLLVASWSCGPHGPPFSSRSSSPGSLWTPVWPWNDKEFKLCWSVVELPFLGIIWYCSWARVALSYNIKCSINIYYHNLKVKLILFYTSIIKSLKFYSFFWIIIEKSYLSQFYFITVDTIP